MSEYVSFDADDEGETERKFTTRAVQDGEEPDPETGALVPPLYHSTTYVLDGPGETISGYDYKRTGNPTREALETKIASLEEAEHGLCFASGMAAIHAVLVLLESGDRVVAEENVYGGTHRLFTNLLPRYGIEVEWVDATEPGRLRDRLDQDAELLWLESPTNPLLKTIDIERCAGIAEDTDTLTVVDNTLASPYLQNPLSLGADIVVHSATKYLGGHTDALGGAVVTDSADLYSKIKFYQNAIGAVPGTLENFSFLKGAKTLSLRMNRACENASSIARYLDEHPVVNTVYYPGLPGHPGYEVAQKQMDKPGALLSVELDAGERELTEFVSELDLFPLAVSLGAVESLLNHPWSMTHACVPEEEKRRQGITPGLLRLSIGIEDEEDLINDLEQAFRSVFSFETAVRKT